MRSTARLNDPDKPVASFLFAGPTGVGKTYLGKMLAQQIFEAEDSFIQVDMSELMDQHSSSKLIGAPPGYIGYDKGGKLTERVRRNPYSLILFDEVEKAHGDVLNTLLQILEEGQLTDSLGRKVNFKNSIIVMTTNMGAEKLSDNTKIGFKQLEGEEAVSEAKSDSLKEIKKQFKPELVNRIDEIVTFSTLNKTDAHKIVNILFDKYVKRVKVEHNITLILHKSATEYFTKKGFSKKYGARELSRTIKREFETKFSQLLLKGEVKPDTSILCSVKESEVRFRKTTRKTR